MRATFAEFFDQHDGAGVLAVDFGDPATLAFSIVFVDEVGDDLRAHSLERRSPTVLLSIKLGVAFDDPAEIARHRRAQLDYGSLGRPRLRLVIEQRFNGVHGGNQSSSLFRLEFFEGRAGVALRTAVKRREGLSPRRRQRDVALPGIARRDFSLDQSAFFEIAQRPAQVAGVEIESTDNLTRGRRTAPRDLVEEPSLAERIRAVEIGLAQHAELSGVEPVETAHGGNAGFFGVVLRNDVLAVAGGHQPSVG